MSAQQSLAGYAWLIDFFKIKGVKLTNQIEISNKNSHREKVYFATKNLIIDYFKPQFAPKENFYHQLEFAFKYEGINLALFAEICLHLDPLKLSAEIDLHPSSKGARRIGYLYEWVTGNDLSIQRAVGGAYIDLLDEAIYVTGEVKKNVKWRINDNLLGTPAYCPIIKKDHSFNEDIVNSYKAQIALHFNDKTVEERKVISTYLFAKESRCSCAIEGLEDSVAQVDRLLFVLRQVLPLSLKDVINEYYLTTLHNEMIDKRYAKEGFRESEYEYVAEYSPDGTSIINYISPPKSMLTELMAGLNQCMDKSSNLDAFSKAAVLSFSTLFFHLYEFGNERLQRFLIHQVLCSEHVLPQGLIIPISSSIYKNRHEYTRIIEERYNIIRNKVDYDLSADLTLSVKNLTELSPYFKYPDLTDATAFIHQSVKNTLEHELSEGIKLVERLSTFKHAIKSIIDIPVNRLELLANQYYINNGVIQGGHRHQFKEINDDEFERISHAYHQNFCHC